MQTDEWDTLNKGKSYEELLKISLKKTEKIRKARMEAAREARRERKRKGIDISIAKIKMNSSI